MKTKHLLLLSGGYSLLPDQIRFNNSKTNTENRKTNNAKRNITQGIEKEMQENKNVAQIIEGILKLSSQFAELPILLTGPLRHLKVEPHYREPTRRIWGDPNLYRKTSKIRLTGNWIEKAGFNTHERIGVIRMHRMLIIVPEIYNGD